MCISSSAFAASFDFSITHARSDGKALRSKKPLCGAQRLWLYSVLPDVLQRVGVAGCHNRKGIVGDVGGKRDIGIAERGVDEVVVMRGEEQPARNALGNPLLMQHQAVVIGDAQIEQCGLARNNEVKAVLRARSAERGRELLALFAEEARRVELFHLVDGGDAGGKRHGAT